jgi:hypothetical protein
MRPIHIVVRLHRKLAAEDLAAIKQKATEGFILEPDPEYELKWKTCAERLVEGLRMQGRDERAEIFLKLQEKMVEHRRKTLHCSTMNVPLGESGSSLELLLTDGINVGRFSLKKDTAVANAWIEAIDHDVYVVRRMLTALCGELIQEDAMIEGSGRYKAWVEETENKNV